METRKENVLIIAGGESDRKVLTRYLEEAGYEVTQATDGQQGFEMVKTLKPEVVLLDLHVTGFDASEFVQSVASDDVLRIIPVIVLAARTEMEAIERCLALGADDYLVRPFSATMLKAQVREFQVIRQRRQEERERAKERLREKIEHDVEIARDIQQSFLPSELPQPEGWEIAAFFRPAREVAGDFYDAFTMSQGRRVGLVIADVCDKGVGAALFMALIRSLTRAFAQQNYSLNLMDGLGNGLMSGGQLATGGRRRSAPSIGTTSLMNAVVLTNNYITTNHLQLNYFATLFFGMIDPATGALAYINGGHCPPIIISQNGEIKGTLKASGPAVGMLPDATFEMNQACLDPGDILFAYTDGATDARDPNGKLFTEKRLMALVQQPISSAGALLNRVETTLRDHIATADRYDDITMMAVRRIPLPERD